MACCASLTSVAATAAVTASTSQLLVSSFQGLRLTAGPISAPKSLTAVSRPRVVAAASAATIAPAAIAPAAAIPVLSYEGSSTGNEATLSLRTARPETAKAVVHRAVVTYMQNKRSGTASTKTRAEVRGGGRKPYKQKGTGGARRGSQRTPLRPGGGVVFGPKPKDWTIKINKKESWLAVGTALQSAASVAGSVIVIEDLATKVESPKTRDFVAALKRWGVDYKQDRALLLTMEMTENLDLATRNIETLKVVTPNALNIYDILRADKLLLTVSGVEYLNMRFGDVLVMEGEDGEIEVELVGEGEEEAAEE